MGKCKYYENDHVEVPEEYLNMSLEELREKKEELYKQISQERGKRRHLNIFEQIANVPTFNAEDIIDKALKESEKKYD